VPGLRLLVPRHPFLAEFGEPLAALQDGLVHRAFPHPPAELNQRYFDKVVPMHSSIEDLEPLGGALGVQQMAHRSHDCLEGFTEPGVRRADLLHFVRLGHGPGETLKGRVQDLG